MTNTTTVLIDADIVAYHAAATVQIAVDFGDGIFSLYADEREAQLLADSRIAQIVESFGAAPPVLALSRGETGYWRHDLFPAYKGNRTQPKPIVLAALRDYMRETYTVVEHPRLEADDVLGILATSGVYANPVLFSEDKDLDLVPCTRARQPGLVYTITPRQAEENHLLLALAGDPGDGFKGVPGIGPKKARKILSKYLDGKEDVSWAWRQLVTTYESKGMSVEEALVQARIAYVLRSSDYTKGIVKLWNPPL